MSDTQHRPRPSATRAALRIGWLICVAAILLIPGGTHIARRNACRHSRFGHTLHHRMRRDSSSHGGIPLTRHPTAGSATTSVSAYFGRTQRAHASSPLTTTAARNTAALPHPLKE